MISFYVLCIDYGRDGQEAIVNPEETRRGVVSEVRTILAKADRGISFIWHVKAGEVPEDITQEIIDEALSDIEAEPIDRQALRFDHAMDHRKSYVGV